MDIGRGPFQSIQMHGCTYDDGDRSQSENTPPWVLEWTSIAGLKPCTWSSPGRRSSPLPNDAGYDGLSFSAPAAGSSATDSSGSGALDRTPDETCRVRPLPHANAHGSRFCGGGIDSRALEAGTPAG